MPQEESKPVDAAADTEAANEAVQELKDATQDERHEEDDGDEDDVEEAENTEQAAPGTSASEPKAKKKSKKRKKIKDALGAITSGSSTGAPPTSIDAPLPAEAIDNLTSQQLTNIMASNPALAGAIPSTNVANQRELREALKKLSVADLATGMGKGKNAKDMAGYKFWSTQPVPRFDEAAAGESSKTAVEAPKEVQQQPKKIVEGPIKQVDKDQVPKKPAPLVEGFEWSDMDLEEPKQLAEVQDLLCFHYVEDDEAMFRFNYSVETLNWALKAPEWKKSWHVGVRATKSQKLVAFISAIPIHLRVRENTLNASEVNFLCIHKKLRSKRLAPVLITEITRRCNVEGVYQAIFTAGIVLPKPVASCRYFHRALDWEKLYNVGFSPLPSHSTKARQIAKYKLPDRTSTQGLRAMKEDDADAVAVLLRQHLKRMDLAQEFTREEVLHWLLDNETDPKSSKRAVWTYVVEDGRGKVTDFFSFYSLESTVIQASGAHTAVRAAYLFYYGTERAEQGNKDVLKERLNQLVKDALILAKQARFDVFNALTLLDNPLFLIDQKFGAGDGQLHYYLFNYRTADIPPGVDKNNNVDDTQKGGIGMVML